MTMMRKHILKCKHKGPISLTASYLVPPIACVLSQTLHADDPWLTRQTEPRQVKLSGQI